MVPHKTIWCKISLQAKLIKTEPAYARQPYARILIHPSIHWSLGSVPVGVQCPLTSSLGEFLGYWAGSGILGYRPYWCPLPFPFALHILVFFHSLFTCNWILFAFLLYGRRICTNSVDPSLTHFLGELPGVGLALVPEAEQRCAWSRILDPKFCPGRGRTLDLGI